MAIKIARIHDLNDLTLKQLRHVADEFKVKGKIGKLGFSDLKAAIQNSQVFKSKFGNHDTGGAFQLCYSRNAEYVYTLTEFCKDKHQFVIPTVFYHDSIKTSDQKKQVLLQICKYGEEGEGHFFWKELLTAQKLDVAKEFKVQSSDLKDRNLEDMLIKPVKYTETFGKTALEEIKLH